MKPLYIYNLFPLLFNNIKEWEKQVVKIEEMGFNCIYINPFHYPGFSGSLYSPKDYYRYNPKLFCKDKPEEEQLKDFIKFCESKKIDVYMDLVINHTAFDCVLVEQHKNWYSLLENGELKRPGAWENGKYITWGDLVTLNIESSPDKDNLWDYLLNVCLYYLKLGFKGFRCDAAYQVPNEFWQFIISKIKKQFPDVVFLAETLGCTPVQIQSISGSGFNYIFNSSKWWNYNDSWCLEQYSITKNIAPSISFPETHDTKRLFEEVEGNETAFLQRMYFEAIFSKGFMITSGFEFGFKNKLNVVTTTSKDWENTGKDYSEKIRKILEIKKSLAPLNEESSIDVVDQENWANVFCFIKEWEKEKVLVVLNKDVVKKQKISIPKLASVLDLDKIMDYSPEGRIAGLINDLKIELNPGEVKIFASNKIYKG
jgi:starch synthase (maltosyl-transferring)